MYAQAIYLATLAGLTAKNRVTINGFFVGKDSAQSGAAINFVNFNLTGHDGSVVECTTQSLNLPFPKEIDCKDSKHRFSLQASEDGTDFSLKIYRELNLPTNITYWGEGNVPTTCQAAKAGSTEHVCTQKAPVDIVVWNKKTPPAPVDANWGPAVGVPRR
ncbi:hypothetical protein JDV02_009725 [Purpureocillium takamizusanense]|uniref:AA1-like domain-containing protein n=1 Tax=Purpureocillium takamizusanense TaxID=2060973 RepID=A0A9Q8QQC3_9HYPO|nr:uncharacterized protein JDV02_009725 [Purpureocillium takamizusanense]UNI23935.1 hypothetical protein JDV02_009725 [Purpureocillium takamizusanense]